MEELKIGEFRDEKSKKKIYTQPQLEEIGKMKIITKGEKDISATDADGIATTKTPD